MNTQLDEARSGRITPAMKAAAASEKRKPGQVRAEIARGRAVLPVNPHHKNLRPVVVGRDFRTKVNANIGLSTEQSDCPQELRKLRIALEAGADFVMDLSVGPNLSKLRLAMLAACPAPFGTVPIYEAVCRTGGTVASFDPDMLIQVIAEQAAQGVDFMTLHAGLLKEYIPLALKRKAGIVSRGGAILASWMNRHGQQNPLYMRWQKVLEICKAHDVTISLGDGLRPGCLADASDKAQFAELDTIGALVRQCHKHGVQVMVEGPGHVPFDQIRMNVEREQKICAGAPFYVLGPVVTDVAPGYDHISACIGACAAATYGAALLCYVTPAEHLGLPTEDEVREGVMAFRIAAHAADVARGLGKARDWDDAMTKARVAFDWDRQFQLAMDGKKAKERFQSSLRPDSLAELPGRRSGIGGQALRGRDFGGVGKIMGKKTKSLDHCSMCGAEFCAMRISQKIAAAGKTAKKNIHRPLR